MANLTGVPVTGTRRELTFDEVGQAKAFAVAHGVMLIRSNPHGSQLWQQVQPQSDLDAITEGMGRI